MWYNQKGEDDMVQGKRPIFVRVFAVCAAAMLLGAALMSLGEGEVYGEEGTTMKTRELWPGEIEGWKIAEGPTDYDPKTAYTYMNGAAELFIAYDMKSLAVVRYERQGRPAVTLEVYRMGSPADAWGLFSFESDDPGAGIGQGSEFGGGLLRFWKGHYFVSVFGDGPGEDVEAATLKIGRLTAEAVREQGAPPVIMALLPPGEAPFARTQAWYFHSHILLNQRFFVSNKNILNLTARVEAALGRYENGKEKVHLLLVKYPDQAGADAALSTFRKAYMPEGADKSAVKTENSKWTAAERYGDYVAVVFDGPDEPFAQRMIRAASSSIGKEAR
jgi:hypothetical protein